MGFLAPPRPRPAGRRHRLGRTADAGEPYDDPEAQQIVRILQRFHSAYYMTPTRRPPPLFVATGFNDDLFPVDEALRFVNRTAARWPRLPLSLFLGDFGHQRAANKLRQRAAPAEGRSTPGSTTTCAAAGRAHAAAHSPTPRPARARRSPPAPFRAADFARLARARCAASPPAQTVSSTEATPPSAPRSTRSPSGDGCATVPADGAAGNRELRAGCRAAAPHPGRRANDHRPPRRAARRRRRRSSPAGSGTSRPDGTAASSPAASTAPGRTQLMAAPPRRLALRPRPPRAARADRPDPPFARPSNSPFEIELGSLQLRLPVRQRPNCRFILPDRSAAAAERSSSRPGHAAAFRPALPPAVDRLAERTGDFRGP